MIDVQEILNNTDYKDRVVLSNARRALKVAFNCKHADYLEYEIGKELGGSHRVGSLNRRTDGSFSHDDDDRWISLAALGREMLRSMRDLINIDLTEPK